MCFFFSIGDWRGIRFGSNGNGFFFFQIRIRKLIFAIRKCFVEDGQIESNIKRLLEMFFILIEKSSIVVGWTDVHTSKVHRHTHTSQNEWTFIYGFQCQNLRTHAKKCRYIFPSRIIDHSIQVLCTAICQRKKTICFFHLLLGNGCDCCIYAQINISARHCCARLAHNCFRLINKTMDSLCDRNPSRKYNMYYFAFQLTESFASRITNNRTILSVAMRKCSVRHVLFAHMVHKVVNKVPEVIKQNVILCSLARHKIACFSPSSLWDSTIFGVLWPTFHISPSSRNRWFTRGLFFFCLFGSSTHAFGDISGGKVFLFFSLKYLPHFPSRERRKSEMFIFLYRSFWIIFRFNFGSGVHFTCSRRSRDTTKRLKWSCGVCTQLQSQLHGKNCRTMTLDGNCVRTSFQLPYTHSQRISFFDEFSIWGNVHHAR